MQFIKIIRHVCQIFVLILISSGSHIYAQKTDFSGTWVLKNQIHLFGPNYSNGVPLEIEIKQTESNITIRRISYVTNDQKDTTDEILDFDGRPTVIATKSKRNKNIELKWEAESELLIHTVQISYPNDNTKIETTRNETWHLSKSKNEITISKKDYYSSTDSLIFEVKGEYFRKETTSSNLNKSNSTGGINFIEGLTWDQILKKAKEENKFIFVDCYATWCKPCKEMDKFVYTNDSLGSIVNSRFISVKIQMDTAKNDNAQVKEWYADAKRMRLNYNVTAFPTYLFFSAEGKIIHKSLGYKKIARFAELASDASNPDRQYYTRLDVFNFGKLQYSSMPYLANYAAIIGDKENAQKVAKEYTDNYLVHLNNDQLFTKDNLTFLNQFTKKSSDKGFSIFYNYPQRVNAVMQDDKYAESFIDHIILSEEIGPAITSAIQLKVTELKWRKIERSIKKKYNGAYAKRVILSGKISWFGWKENWKEYSKCKVQFVEEYGKSLEDFDLNNSAWDIFEHSFNRKELNIAVTWIKKVLDRNPDWSIALDTYANLMYKLGFTEEAIAIQSAAVKKDPKNKELATALEKMQKGLPTWSEIK